MSFNFAIMGPGDIAGKFVEAVGRVENCAITAVASKSQQRAAAFADRHGIAAAYGSYEKMLRSEKIDCVYLATIQSAHYELAKLCVQNNVPVLCEKAMFLTRAEAEEVFALARKKRVFMMEAMWSCFLPAVQQARQLVRDGAIGEVMFFDCSMGYYFDPETNKRLYDPSLGGGTAADLTVYNYELMEYFLGGEMQKFDCMSTWGPSGVDVANQVSVQYKNKLASLSSTCAASLDSKLVLAGSKGRIIIPQSHAAEELFLYGNDGKLVRHFKDEQTSNGFVYEIKEVIRCVSTGLVESETVPHRVTTNSAAVIETILKNKPA